MGVPWVGGAGDEAGWLAGAEKERQLANGCPPVCLTSFCFLLPKFSLLRPPANRLSVSRHAVSRDGHRETPKNESDLVTIHVLALQSPTRFASALPSDLILQLLRGPSVLSTEVLWLLSAWAAVFPH